MRKLARRGMVLVLALTVMASPLMAVSAEANNGRGRGPRWGNRGNGGWQREGQNRGSPGYNNGDNDRGYNGGYRGDGGSYRSNPGYNGGYRGDGGYRNYSGRNYSGYRNYPVYGGRRYYGHRESGIVPFIGGLTFGTIIGSQIGHRDHYYYCPPPPPPVRVIHRVYVYHDDTCNMDFTDYGDWCDHLVTYHRVPSCEVRDLYPQYDGGYWEEY